MVRVLPEVPSEGGGPGMGAALLVQGVPTPVLPVVPARGPHPGAARHRRPVLGRGDRRDRRGGLAGRSAV